MGNVRPQTKRRKQKSQTRPLVRRQIKTFPNDGRQEREKKPGGRKIKPFPDNSRQKRSIKSKREITKEEGRHSRCNRETEDLAGFVDRREAARDRKWPTRAKR